jgi:[ribosomal protein S5]-alanine N-acetyltransferase
MEIQGQGFTLRGWKADDVISIQKHADNSKVYSFLLDRFPHPYTMEAAEIWVNHMLNLQPNYNFVIDIDDKAVGVIGLEMRDDVYRKSPLIGYWIGEEFWGKGIMTKAIRLVTAFAFTELDMLRIQAGVLSNNPTSMRVLEKAGYVKEGILKNAIIKNEVVLDEHIYGIVK